MSDLTDHDLWRTLLLCLTLLIGIGIVCATVYNVTDRIVPVHTWQTTLAK